MSLFSIDYVMCRTVRPMRLYRSVYDTDDCGAILPANSIFYSRKQYNPSDKKMVHVTEADNPEIPTGYWCSANSMQFMPVTDKTPQKKAPDETGSEVESEKILVKAPGAILYRDMTSDVVIPHGLAIGDTITTDHYAEIPKDGSIQMRYRIDDTDSKDDTIKGSWVLMNSAVRKVQKVVEPVATAATVEDEEYGIAAHDNVDDALEWGEQLVETIGNGAQNIGQGMYQAGVSGVNKFVVGATGVYNVATDTVVTTGGRVVDVTKVIQSDIERDGIVRTGLNYTIGGVKALGNLAGKLKDAVTNSITKSSGDGGEGAIGMIDKEMLEKLGLSEGDIPALLAEDMWGDVYGERSSDMYDIMGQPIGRMHFVHGMPFQYTHITDRRGASNGFWGDSGSENIEGAVNSGQDLYGRSYAKEIAANMPVAVITPGVPRFLENLKGGFDLAGRRKSAGNALLGSLNIFSSGGASAEDVFKNLMDEEGTYQYYSLRIDTGSYFEYVNGMCQTSAQLLSLSGEKYRGQSCTKFDWGAYNDFKTQDYGIFGEVIGPDNGIAFAYDPTGSVSDQISTTTTESMLASLFTGVNSQARELEFITGYTGLTGLSDALSSAAGNYTPATISDVDGADSVWAQVKNAVGRFTGWFRNSVHGMNMRFPELWSDTNHSTSYQIEMHFISPYATNFCKWRYVLVPFFHIFALAAPRSDSNVSQYASPFLIRAFSKGYFNVEMGIIESLNMKRFGDGKMIAADGVPMQIDIDVNFKDLYHVLAMTARDKDFRLFMSNTGLIDMIGTVSGTNMNTIDMGQRINLIYSAATSSMSSIGGNWMRHISDRARNSFKGLWGM